MPYVSEDRRANLTPIVGKYAENGGDLNYQFTCLIKEYLKYNGETYKSINDILGALEGSKLEFYRRVVSDLEEKKILENGDVYE